MSKNTFSKISAFDEIVKEHGKKGLQTLILFKLLKNALIEKIKLYKEGEVCVNEDEINKICFEKACQIVLHRKDVLTEQDMKELLNEIFKRKVVGNYFHLNRTL